MQASHTSVTARAALLMASVALGACQQQAAQEPVATLEQAQAETGVPANPERNVYFGDLHLHTSYSLDAAGEFDVTTTPEEAYRFAMGEPVTYNGQVVQRHAPLDFLAVTDHAEYLGNVRPAKADELPLPDYLMDRIGFRAPPENPFANPALAGLFGEELPVLSDPEQVHGHWQDIISTAERFNRPGRFTTFVAFEYSPTFMANMGSLHRNVIFRGPDYPAMPFAATDSLHPEALWAYAELNRERGIDSLMIPHNSNLSSGMSFSFEDSFNEPIGPEYARLRARNEPLVEMTQKKGTSETTPALSPDDEFANFALIASRGDDRANYIRPGLMRGLEMAERMGINPFEQGFVGASDFHSGISASEEDNFPGALGNADDHSDPVRVLQEHSALFGSTMAAYVSASGITAVWAESNTREAIFAALRRRETYATSGPRMRVRLFAGWSDPGDLVDHADWAARAYRWGVPMGGNLAAAGQRGHVPHFVFQAARDPLSGNLDRIQIVKLWRDNGVSRERVYDVAWSPGRRIDPASGRLQPVGNTVDTARATYANSIGAGELAGSWSDPDFNPAEQALYYARVLEIPTPRWSTYLAARAGLPLPTDAPAWLQERAWTSPIYYTP